MATRPRMPTERSETESPVEQVLVLMRSEWRAGTSGRYLDKIRKAIEGLESHAPAQQTVEVIRSIKTCH